MSANVAIAQTVVAAGVREAVSLKALLWPLARMGEGIDELARRARLRAASHEPLTVPATVASDPERELPGWIEWAGERLGLETEAIETTVADLEATLRVAGPAVIQVRNAAASGFVLLLGRSFSSLRVLGPDLKTHRLPVAVLRAAICLPHEAPLAIEIERLLRAAGLPSRRRAAARAAMLDERVGATKIRNCWLLRTPPTANFWAQLLREGLPQRLIWMLALFAVVYSLELVSWALVGSAALRGQLNLGWMEAWLLLVLSLVPLRLLGGWLNSTFALGASRVLKRRLLAGALKFDLDRIRHLGAGQLLGRVMESQTLESLAVNGGLAVLVASIELCFAAWVLTMGAGSYLHLALLVSWLGVTVWLSLRFIRRMRTWTLARLDMTHQLVERMVGHRTSVAQEDTKRRDTSQDAMINDYVETSKQMDGTLLPVVAGIPAGWMLLGIGGLAPAFISGSGTALGLAIGFGGVLLAGRALWGIANGLSSLAGAALAWRQVGPFFRAADQGVTREPYISTAQFDPWQSDTAQPGRNANLPDKLIDASDLVFRYQENSEPVLRAIYLSIQRGERILLEGPSGGGKSTLASLLVGLRRPESGLLLLNGLDRHSLGDAWHKLATEAPQFHENHILSGTLGFNLLMGRNWPASDADLEEARQVCIELGLGELLERMPSGMNQMVGETGWQLSHGERSRIFLARALLQKAQLTVMDESFAALDPETLQRCLNCAMKRARTLIVIAHP